MDKTTTWLVRGAALVVILGGAFAFLKSDEWKGMKKEIEVSKQETKSKKSKESICLDLYKRVAPEGSPPASSAFMSKCGPIAASVWGSCFMEANKITLDSTDERHQETFRACALKRIERILPEN